MIEIVTKGRVKIPGHSELGIVAANNRVGKAFSWARAQMRVALRDAFKLGGHAQRGGRSWRSLRPATIRKKGHDRILIRRHRMRRRVGVQGSAVMSGGVVNYTLVATNSATYSHFHQYGFFHKTAGWVAARPPIVITKQDRELIEAAILEVFVAPKRAKKKVAAKKRRKR